MEQNGQVLTAPDSISELAARHKSDSLLVARSIRKRFGGVAALRGVDLDLAAGERLAIVGENGAGKSTLMNVLIGLVSPDEGQVTVGGTDITGSAEAARRAGLALVHQERSLVPHLSVAENVLLGDSPTRGGFVQRGRQDREAAQTLARLGMSDLDPHELVERLSAAEQTFVEIAKALHRDPRILILDEPSAMLTPQETTKLIELTKQLSEQGMAIVYISHRLPEIYAFCDHVMVLRDGSTVGRFNLATLSTDELVSKMAGRALALEFQQERNGRNYGDVAISARNVVTERVKNVSLEVRTGEIVGIGGLVGSGRTELLRALVGLDPRKSGHVEVALNGKHRTVRSYAKSVRDGIGFVPEERRTDGVILSFAIGDSLLLPMISRGWPLASIRPSSVRAQATELMQKLRVAAPSSHTLVNALSGGNQQKVAFGKWLSVAPRVVILDEPTRGVDVGAKAEIHRLIRTWADSGMAIIFVSSDMPELLALADRVEVMRDGALVATFAHGEATEERIIGVAAGQNQGVGRDGS